MHHNPFWIEDTLINMLLIQLERHFMGHFTIWLKCRVSLREITTVTQTPSLPAVVVALWDTCPHLLPVPQLHPPQHPESVMRVVSCRARGTRVHGKQSKLAELTSHQMDQHNTHTHLPPRWAGQACPPQKKRWGEGGALEQEGVRAPRSMGLS